jgi:hypothetical protein
MAARNGKDWRQLCAAATVESDSDKLFSLVSEILQVFDEDDQKLVNASRRSSLPCRD